MKKSLYLLLLLLFPIGLQAQSEVIVLHPDEGKAEVNEAEYTRIFLAGTIDMGKSIDWQKATCYNPQIEMFARFKMKSSFHKTKRII